MRITIILLTLIFSQAVCAQTTTFTYQGRLAENGQPASGDYDFEFSMFDAAVGGGQIGSTLMVNSVSVSNEVFTVQLDFGDIFGDGTDRFLQIDVRQTGGGAFTPLTPRQAITSTPYALRSLSSDTSIFALDSNLLEGLGASAFALTTDPRLSDNRNPLPGSPSYVQNRTTQQPSSNFNISGTGTAGIFNANTVYRIANSTVLNTTGTRNTFVGFGAGPLITSGERNTFVGEVAGSKTSTGSRNTFVGSGAGADNFGGSDNSSFGYNAGLRVTTGGQNSIFGVSAGGRITTSFNNSMFGYEAGLNATGSENSFFGASAGISTTSGFSNSFFGRASGEDNTQGDQNAFFGEGSGRNNTTGDGNAFFGRIAGLGNTEGDDNTFLGFDAGGNNTTGTDNTIIGSGADVLSGNLTFATAIGAGAVVTGNSTVQLGRSGLDFVRVGTFGSSGLSVGHVCMTADRTLSHCSGASPDHTGNYQEQIVEQGVLINELLDRLSEQSEQINRQAEELESLRVLVCSQNQTAEICSNS